MFGGDQAQVSGELGGRGKALTVLQQHQCPAREHRANAGDRQQPLPIATQVGMAIDMLVDAEARVEALVLEGKSEDEVVAANPLADYHDDWNWFFITTEKMTRTLYRSLSSL